MKKILSLTLSVALLSATAAPGYAIDLTGTYADDYQNLETAVNGKVDSSTIFSNGVFDTQNTNANGTVTRIWNEADGGGTQIIDGRSGVKAYTGVNEGSDGTNIYVQTYAVDKNTNEGTRINVNTEGAYYTTGKNTYTFTADDEIATKGDLKALASGTSGNKISTDALDDTFVSTVSTNTTDIATLKGVVHQESDGIHIGENSFILDDANGKITYKDSTDTEQAIDFTTTPTVNGEQVATLATAATGTYNNSASGLTATTLQGAIDEVEGRVDTAEGKISTLETTVGDSSSGLVKNVADNASAIAALDSRVTTNTTDIATNTSAIADNSTAIASLQTSKQDTISDLADIRNNATAGKSANETIATYGNIVTHNAAEFQAALSTDQEAAVNSGITAAKVTAYDGYAGTIAGKQDALNTDQLAATNSGITAAKVANYDGYDARITANANNITALQNSKQDNLTATQLAAVNSGITDDKVTQIATNTANITALQNNKQDNLTATQLAAVDSGITGDKVTQIATNTANITALQNNKQDKLTAAQQDAVDSGITGEKVAQIATNTANIAALQTDKQDKLNATQLAAVDSGITAAAVTQITTNTTNINANTADINDLKDDVANKQDKLNTTQLAAVDSGITAAKVAQYDLYGDRIDNAEDDIDALQDAVGNLNYTTENYVQDGDDLTTAVSSLDGQMKTNTDGIEANKTNIGSLLYDNTNYVASGDNLTTAVGKLDGQVKTNADNIATNTADIAALGDRMDDAEGNIGDMDFTGSEYLAGATSLTEAANLLDTQVAINEVDIATNKAAIDTLNADVDTTGSVLNSIRENAANANYANATSGLTADTLQGAIDENAAHIGGLNYTSTNYVAAGNNLTQAVSALDGQVKTNADNIGDMTFTGTSAAGATSLTSAVNQLDAAIGDKTFITNASGAADVTAAINQTNTALGDVSTLSGHNITATNVTGAVNELDAAIGDVSTLAAAKGRDVKTTADVTSAIKAMDADFHRADDGRIHIGSNSFILDDSNGNFSYEDPSGVERPINFTQTPTVNGSPLATTREVDHLRDESRTGIASVAALTALQPLGIDSGRLQFSVGSGFYQGESALAAGANYYVTDNLVLNAGGAMDTSLDNHVIKAGLSVGFFKPKKARTINANNVVINAAQHTTVKASKDVAYVTPEQLKALMDRIEVLEKELAKRK